MAYEEYKPRQAELQMVDVIERLQAEIERLRACLKERDKLCKKLEAEIEKLRANG